MLSSVVRIPGLICKNNILVLLVPGMYVAKAGKEETKTSKHHLSPKSVPTCTFSDLHTHWVCLNCHWNFMLQQAAKAILYSKALKVSIEQHSCVKVQQDALFSNTQRTARYDF